MAALTSFRCDNSCTVDTPLIYEVGYIHHFSIFKQIKYRDHLNMYRIKLKTNEQITGNAINVWEYITIFNRATTMTTVAVYPTRNYINSCR